MEGERQTGREKVYEQNFDLVIMKVYRNKLTCEHMRGTIADICKGIAICRIKNTDFQLPTQVTHVTAYNHHSDSALTLKSTFHHLPLLVYKMYQQLHTD